MPEATAQSTTETPAPPAAPPEEGYAFHGSLGLRWRGRSTKDDSDQDAYVTARLYGGDPARDAWTWQVSAQSIADIDGAGDPASPFYSLEDTGGNRVETYLYEAYAEHHTSSEFESVRIGRHTSFETPVFIWLDGITAITRAAETTGPQLGGYAGRSVRQFETSVEGDTALGLWGSWHPWRRGRVRLDWMHLEDEERLGDDGDDLYQLALGQGLGEHLRLDGTWSRLGHENRDASLRGTWSDPEHDLALHASWYRLLEEQGQLAFELDPFTSALLPLLPYTQGRVSVSKGLGKRWRFEAGAEARRLDDPEDESTYNHDYDRVWGTASVAELPLELELAATGEIWDGGGNATDAWGADLARRFDDGSRLSLGTYYALYELDLSLGAEREDVRTWYARWREERGPGWAWDLRYEYEDDPGTDLSTLRVGGTWSF